MDRGSAVKRAIVTTLMPVGGSRSIQVARADEAVSERFGLIDAISRAVQSVATERPLVVVLDDPEPDPSSPLVFRVFPLHQVGGEVPRPDDGKSTSLEAMLVRDGVHVVVTWGSEIVRMRASKGIDYLARLLASPGEELHVLAIASPGGRSFTQVDPTLHVGTDDAGPLLDAKAKAAYRRRIRELQEEIDEAESFNDPIRASKAREELGFIADHLSEAVGLGGRDRKVSSNTERARVNVTKRIKTAIEKISTEAPRLGRHLDTTIRTGTYLSYSAEVEPTLEWKIDL